MSKTANYLDKDLSNYLSQLGHIEFDVGMADYTTFKTGGPADVLIIPSKSENIELAVKALKSASIPLTVI